MTHKGHELGEHITKTAHHIRKHRAAAHKAAADIHAARKAAQDAQGATDAPGATGDTR